MVTRLKLKIWALVLHAVIIVAVGHGAGLLILLEFFHIGEISTEPFHIGFSSDHNLFPVFAVSALIGQLLVIASMFQVHVTVERVLLSVGVIFLWLSIIYLKVQERTDAGMLVPVITIVPFLISTIVIFFGRNLQRLYHWVKT